MSALYQHNSGEMPVASSIATTVLRPSALTHQPVGEGCNENHNEVDTAEKGMIHTVIQRVLNALANAILFGAAAAGALLFITCIIAMMVIMIMTGVSYVEGLFG